MRPGHGIRQSSRVPLAGPPTAAIQTRIAFIKIAGRSGGARILV